MLIFWLSLSTFGVCLASGFVPLINAELYLLAASAASPRHAAVPLLVTGTLGQMTAKVIMYLGGQGALRLPSRRFTERMDDAAALMERWRGRTGTLIFVSALAGLPPFFVVSLLCGMARVGLLRFVVLGTVGRLLRFSPFVLFPDMVRDLL